MTEGQSRTIIWLLAGILLVLLFGASQVTSAAQTALWVTIPLAAVALVIWGVVALVKNYLVEIDGERKNGGPWRAIAVAGLAIPLNLVGVALAGLEFLSDGTPFGVALLRSPWTQSALAIMALAAVVLAFERWNLIWPAIERAANGWLLILIGPIAAPAGVWRRMQEERERGNQIAHGAVLGRIASTFVRACALWLAAVAFPLMVVFILAMEASR